MDFKENRVIYEPGKLTLETFKKVINDVFKPRSEEHLQQKILVGSKTYEIMNLLHDDSEKSKLRLKEISEEIRIEAQESHVKNAESFIMKYGRVLYAFCERISKKESFLAYETGDYLWWDAIETGKVDEDDSFMIIFSKGEFSYIRDTCSGYGDRDILEKGIKKERVLQLLKK